MAFQIKYSRELTAGSNEAKVQLMKDRLNQANPDYGPGPIIASFRVPVLNPNDPQTRCFKGYPYSDQPGGGVLGWDNGNGPFPRDNGSQIHTVAIVGYYDDGDPQTPNDWWICKNSWGKNWGERFHQQTTPGAVRFGGDPSEEGGWFRVKMYGNHYGIEGDVYELEPYPAFFVAPPAPIQQAVNVAPSGSSIFVHAGVYHENIVIPSGKNIRIASVDGPEVTIIDGQGLGPVVRFVGPDQTSSLVGFTIRNGSGTGTNNRGGGIYCSNSSPSIVGNIIESNTHATLYRGAGIACESGGSPIIERNTIRNNSARYYGGGIYLYWVGDQTTVRNNTIYSNAAVLYDGGGIYCYFSSAIIEAIIEENYIGLIDQDQQPLGNSSARYGGGIYIRSGSPLVRNNYIVANTAAQSGAGAYVYSSTARLLNNTAARNTCTNPSGAGGIHFVTSSSASLASTILWSNEPVNVLGALAQMVRYCDIQGWTGGGAGNIDQDPIFVDPDRGNFRISRRSPCIDAGLATTDYPEHDFDGRGRFDDLWTPNTGLGEAGYPDVNYADIGADEFCMIWVTYPAPLTPCGNDPPVCTVPYCQPTIQQAIDDAKDGDWILVQPGTYQESITFRGKSIYLTSTRGAHDTIIDSREVLGPDQRRTTVRFHSGEKFDAYLDAFTLEGGFSSYSARFGGAISVRNGSHPTIINNLVIQSFSFEGAVFVDDECRPTITDNTITWNLCPGLYVEDDADPYVSNTILWDNGGTPRSELNVHRESETWDNIWYCFVDCFLEPWAVALQGHFNICGGPDELETTFVAPRPQTPVQPWDYHLRDSALCIGAGSENAVGLPLLDFDREPRVLAHDSQSFDPRLPDDDGVDIGGDEFRFDIEVRSVTPNTGSSAGCLDVRLVGLGFDADGDCLPAEVVGVTFGGQPSASWQYLVGCGGGEEESFGFQCLTAAVPAHAGELVDILVSTQSFTFKLLRAYEYYEKFKRGDANNDGIYDIGDAITILDYLFADPPLPPPGCADAFDVDDNGILTVGDPIYLLSWLFESGRFPPPPCPQCGIDETQDGLGACIPDCQPACP